MKKDDLDDVIREESSRGRKRPVHTDPVKEQAKRREAVMRIVRRGTKEDLRALLMTWGYTKEEIEKVINDYDALFG